MKKTLIISIIIFIWACNPKTEKKISKNISPIQNHQDSINKWCDSIFIADSGLISATSALNFLLLTNETDTVEDNFWNYTLKKQSQEGKYYQKTAKNEYILCLNDYSDAFTTHLIYHLKKGQNTWKILNQKRYYHGNYPCSWESEISGFGKLGNYFYIDICGTGSGFCHSDRVIICESNKDIILPYYHSFFEEIAAEAYECEMTAKANTINGKYFMQIAKPFDYMQINNWDDVEYDKYNFTITYTITDSSELQINNKAEFENKFSKLNFFIFGMYLGTQNF